MFAAHQQCPQCTGAIPREWYVQERPDHGGFFETRLYCEFCGLGIETLWETVDGEPQEVFSLRIHARTEPQCFGGFLQRLEDSRAA